MASITVSARAIPVVEARPNTGSIVIKVGEATVSLAPDEVAQLCQDLSRACLQLRRTASARRGMVPAGRIEICRGNADLVEVQA